MFICKKLVSILGPNEKLFITSIEGKGSAIGFDIYKTADWKEFRKIISSEFNEEEERSFNSD